MAREEEQILSELRDEYDLPDGFLQDVMEVEKNHLFQLRRRNVLKRLHELVREYSQD